MVLARKRDPRLGARVRKTDMRGAVFVTGASAGIGRACVLRFCEAGFEVFAGVRNDSDAEDLRSAAAGRVEPVLLDVTDDRTMRDALASVSRSVGPLHLVNNAGVPYPGPVEFVPLDDLRSQLEVNVVGQIAVTQTFLPSIRERGGRIVFMSSMFGRFSVPIMGCYCASKHALEALADTLRMELKPWRIPVILVEPGATKTRIWEKYARRQERLLEQLPDQDRALYEKTMEGVGRTASRSEHEGIEPEAVARVVERCLTKRRPKARYLVGSDARLAGRISRLVPARLQDEATLRYMGLPRRDAS